VTKPTTDDWLQLAEAACNAMATADEFGAAHTKWRSAGAVSALLAR
jgi:hypothetical protein